jgi:hypothetical protein
MSDGFELYEGLNHQLDLADNAIHQLAKLGREKAETEHDYRVALAKMELRERAENNTPVTIIGDICRGNPEIARLKVKRDCADSLYDACRESIYLYKKRADVYREQIAREYTQAGQR